MESAVVHTRKISKRAILKAFVLVAIAGAGLCLFRFTPAKQLLTPEVWGSLLDSCGFWAPLFFIFIYATGICLFLPASLPTLLGAAIFGAYWGFLYSLIGALAGASGGFFIGRALGRDFASSLIGARLRKYDDAIQRNGFAAVLYLRLIYFPFTYLNFGMGLTKIHFWDFFWGTGFGVAVSLFIFTFFGGTLKEVWVSGNWAGLISFKLFIAIGLFIFSLFIPKIIRKTNLIQAFGKEI